MTPERTAALVARWVRFYTRNLPSPIAQRRVDEIDADLHDHIAHERAHGTSDPRIALSVAARMVRGLAADASWRRHALAHHTSPKEVTKMRKSATRVALATGLILLLLGVATQFLEEMNWGLGDFLLAGAVLGGTGLLLELAARRPRSLALIVLGEADDAPGLVLFGCLLIIATVVLAVRTALRDA